MNAIVPHRPVVLEENPLRTGSGGGIQQALLKTVAQVAIRTFYVLGFVLMASALFPIEGMAVAAVAIGSAALSSFFYLPQGEKSISSQKAIPFLKKTEKAVAIPLDPASFPPRGLYASEMNSAFNSLIHFLNSDPALAKRLRLPLDKETMGDALISFGATPRMVEEFYLYLQQNSLSPNRALKLFLNEYQPFDEERARLETFVSNYNHFLRTVHPFTQFLAGYDQAVETECSLVDRNSQSIRYALSRLDSCFPAEETQQIDPAQILQYLIESLPEEHQIEYEEGGEGKRTWGFSIEIDESLPDLEKMLKTQYQGIAFPNIPPILRFQIQRFAMDPNTLIERLKSVWNSIRKIETPVEIPEEIVLPLTGGGEQKYQLAGWIGSVGNSLNKGHFIAGRRLKDQRYCIDDSQVIPVDRQVWLKEFLPQAYLLCYVPIFDAGKPD